MDPTHQIKTWLRDAHAMERSMAKVLERHAESSKDFPEIHERLERHLVETRHQADRVRSCLESLGESASMMKSAAATAMGMLEGRSTGMFRDEPVKNILADYAMEHFEIACYTSLVTAAEQAGLPEIAETCQAILTEEQAMADWLQQQIPGITRLQLTEAMPANR